MWAMLLTLSSSLIRLNASSAATTTVFMEQHDLSKIQKLQEKGKSDKIIKYLSSSDDTVVVAALEALSRIKDEDSVNSIAHMIDNPDTKIRDRKSVV